MTRVTSAPGALLDLHKAAVYLSPAGRPCRWAATHEQAPGQPRVATFLYDLPGGRPATEAGHKPGWPPAAQRWPVRLPLARRHLVLAERLGQHVLDDSLAGRRFYRNDLAALADADAARLRAAQAAGECSLVALVGPGLAALGGPGPACGCRGGGAAPR